MSEGLRAEGLSLAYEGRPVIEDLTLALPPGRFTAILGPNGCGKSTLLRAFARLLPPKSGRVTLDGEDLYAMAPRKAARRLGLSPQSPLAPEGITVADLVARGRTPWRGLLAGWTKADEAARAAAMAATGVTDLAGRPLAELSGGQRRRVWIALLLAQETPHLLLDEPTAWLDPPHQIEVLKLLRRLREEAGRSVVAVLHEFNLTARHADHLVLLTPGRVVAAGPPEEVLTPRNLEAAFGLKARILADPVSATPMVVPEL